MKQKVYVTVTQFRYQCVALIMIYAHMSFHGYKTLMFSREMELKSNQKSDGYTDRADEWMDRAKKPNKNTKNQAIHSAM